jgi:hypothetical protein
MKSVVLRLVVVYDERRPWSNYTIVESVKNTMRKREELARSAGVNVLHVTSVVIIRKAVPK